MDSVGVLWLDTEEYLWELIHPPAHEWGIWFNDWVEVMEPIRRVINRDTVNV